MQRFAFCKNLSFLEEYVICEHKNLILHFSDHSRYFMVAIRHIDVAQSKCLCVLCTNEKVIFESDFKSNLYVKFCQKQFLLFAKEVNKSILFLILMVMFSCFPIWGQLRRYLVTPLRINSRGHKPFEICFVCP